MGPTTLPAKGQVTPVGTQCTVTGWGTTSYGNDISPDILRKVKVPVVSDSDCSDAYQMDGGINYDAELCAGDTVNGGKDSCQGDSGGPLFCDGFQAGVVSYGIDCGQADYPGVYAEVANFIDWLENPIGAADSLQMLSLFVLLASAILNVVMCQ